MKKIWKNKNNAISEEYKNDPEIASMDLTLENVRKVLSDSNDVSYQTHYINGCKDLPVNVVFIDGLVDIGIVNDDVLKPLTQEKALREVKSFSDIIELLKHGTTYHACRKVRETLGETLTDILNGALALIFDKENKAVTFSIKHYERRSIAEPTTENALKSAKDSFIEVLRVNTSLVRSKIRSPYLRIKETIVGRQTNTAVAVIYIENVVNPNLVKEVFKRLDSIDVDGSITPGIIEEYIIDNKWTIVPQVLNTERSDKFCSNIIEGRVGIIIDGLPVTYIVPGTIDMFFQAPEDYSVNYVIGSFVRLVRYISAVIALLLPGFYISITTFHQEMIPTVFALSIIQNKTEVPFPTTSSLLGMILAFEILLEAGIRLPPSIGYTVSIFGALVVGQAAVQAKLISSVVLIVVAATGMAGFTLPNQDLANSFRVFRLIFIILSSIAGLYGLSLGIIIIVNHLNTLESFGVPYFSPFVANEGKGIEKDTLIRLPLSMMKKRPDNINTINKKRQK